MRRASLALVAMLAWAWGASALAEPPSPIDVNTATEQQLEELPGIGHKKAAAIVELRKKKPLTRLTQLMQVRGIGRKTLERLKPFVKIEATPAPQPVQPVQPARAAGEADAGPP